MLSVFKKDLSAHSVCSSSVLAQTQFAIIFLAHTQHAHKKQNVAYQPKYECKSFFSPVPSHLSPR